MSSSLLHVISSHGPDGNRAAAVARHRWRRERPPEGLLAGYGSVDGLILESIAAGQEFLVADLFCQDSRTVDALDRHYSEGEDPFVFDHHETTAARYGGRPWAVVDTAFCAAKAITAGLSEGETREWSGSLPWWSLPTTGISGSMKTLTAASGRPSSPSAAPTASWQGWRKTRTHLSLPTSGPRGRISWKSRKNGSPSLWKKWGRARVTWPSSSRESWSSATCPISAASCWTGWRNRLFWCRGGEAVFRRMGRLPPQPERDGGQGGRHAPGRKKGAGRGARRFGGPLFSALL